jgi:anti-sigma B factor antagonist
MELNVSDFDGVTLLKLEGRLDTVGATRVEVQFNASAVSPGRPALVDLTGVTFLASLGIRMLVTAARSLTGRGAKLVLFGASPSVSEVIEISGLSRLLLIAPSQAEALSLARG